MIRIIHLSSAAVLIITHGLFLVRSYILLKKRANPRKADRVIMQISQLFLPLTLLTGFLSAGSSGTFPAIHTVLGDFPPGTYGDFPKKKPQKKTSLETSFNERFFTGRRLPYGCILINREDIR